MQRIYYNPSIVKFQDSRKTFAPGQMIKIGDALYDILRVLDEHVTVQGVDGGEISVPIEWIDNKPFYYVNFDEADKFSAPITQDIDEAAARCSARLDALYNKQRLAAMTVDTAAN